eukprot:TRINITY_DN21491_c0_g1_i2.p1 TRINITY_DN21491_c0_g1~~TRINITY_DN21491_c0_g1_i2.p1  ORF type:complete len:382 (-),score=67.99 TRINITY_DN21491_c0_g1_i2:91-1236(-)
MQRPVAVRRGWQASAPAEQLAQALAESAPSYLGGSLSHGSDHRPDDADDGDDSSSCRFERTEDGGWQLRLPPADGVRSAADMDLGMSPSGVKLCLPDGSVLEVPWPSGTTASQQEACQARFSKKLGQLQLRLPPQTNVQPCPESEAAVACSKGSDTLAGTAAVVAAPVQWPADAADPRRRQSQPREGYSAAPAAAAAVAQEERLTPLRQTPVAAQAPVRSDPLLDPTIAGELLHSAASNGDAPVRSDPLLDPTIAGELLHSAASNGDVAQLRRILDSRVDPNRQDELGATALEKACMGLSATSLDAAEVLLRSGASPKGKAMAPSTPLHRAATYTNGVASRKMVKLLLEWGADRLAIDRQGRNAADAARAIGLRPPPELTA